MGEETLHSPERKRLVLGYDGGCCGCAAMAKRIEEEFGRKLEIRDLNDP